MKIKRKIILMILFTVVFFFTSCITGRSSDAEGVIGIAWRSDADSEFFTNITRTLEDLGIPYAMVDQVVDYSIPYEGNSVASFCIDENDILLPVYAEEVKSELYHNSNIDEVMHARDYRAVIFTGGEDIAPTLLASPEPWHGIEAEKDYNATRDVSDYLLMTYCIDNDIPVIAGDRRCLVWYQERRSFRIFLYTLKTMVCLMTMSTGMRKHPPMHTGTMHLMMSSLPKAQRLRKCMALIPLKTSLLGTIRH